MKPYVKKYRYDFDYLKLTVVEHKGLGRFVPQESQQITDQIDEMHNWAIKKRKKFQLIYFLYVNLLTEHSWAQIRHYMQKTHSPENTIILLKRIDPSLVKEAEE